MFLLEKTHNGCTELDTVLINPCIYIYIIYIYIFFSAFFPLKKAEQPEIAAFNRIVVNSNIHFLFYWRGDQRTGVDSCNTGQKNM